MPKRKIMRTFKLNEISAVDTPAQEGARFSIAKRAAEPVTKQGVGILLTDVDGHSHLIYNPEDMSGTTSWSYTTDGKDHNHPWIKTMTGEFVIGASAGHSHEIVQKCLVEVTEDEYGKQTVKVIDGLKSELNPSKENPAMSKTTEEQLAEATAAVAKATETTEALQAEVATLKAYGELNDAEKAFYNAIDGDEAKAAWLAKSAEDRAGDINKAADADPVVYKAADGSEFRKSDDPRLIAMAKKMDAEAAELAKSRAEVEDSRLEKRATDELDHLPGEVAVKKAIVKALEGIEDETVRKAAFESVTAKAGTFKAATQTLGTSGGKVEKTDEEVNAEAKLESMAKAHAEKENVSYAKAYDAVLKTKEGSALYAQMSS